MIPETDESPHFLDCLEAFRLGDETLDREHEALCLLINRLAAAIDDQAHWEEAVAIATELVHETHRHFGHDAHPSFRPASMPLWNSRPC